MKAILRPVYFKSGMDDEFKNHLDLMRKLLKDEADILKPLELGKSAGDVDAIIFPQLLGDAFRHVNLLKRIKLPMLITTSDFGAVNMWDWEIVTFLKSSGLDVFAPYNLELTKKICSSLALKRDLNKTKFLMFQDNPGVGMQAEIFKRFYWWEERSERLMREKFGVKLIKKSFKKWRPGQKRSLTGLLKQRLKDGMFLWKMSAKKR